MVAGICNASDSIEAATARLSEVLSEHGASLLIYAQHDRQQAKLPRLIHVSFPGISPTPEIGLNELRDCPITHHVLQTLQPLALLGSGYASARNGNCERLLNQLGGSAFDEIVLVPVPSDDVVHIFLVGLTDVSFEGTERERLIDLMEQFVVGVLVGFGRAKAARFRPGAQGAKTAGKVTAREVECLMWTAKGKTSHEIAIIVGLSEHTINHYLATAGMKLGAVNRTQAVVKALLAGFFDLSQLAPDAPGEPVSTN